jgi:hypothetical protein
MLQAQLKTQATTMAMCHLTAHHNLTWAVSTQAQAAGGMTAAIQALVTTAGKHSATGSKAVRVALFKSIASGGAFFCAKLWQS